MRREARETSASPEAAVLVAWRGPALAVALLLPLLLTGGTGRAGLAFAAALVVPPSITLQSPLPQVGTISASGRYVAWTATQVCGGDGPPAPACSPRAVYLYDLFTGRVTVAARTVFGDTGAIYHYHVSERWLVYLDTGVSMNPALLRWRIVVVDLARHRSMVLAGASTAADTAVPPDLALAGDMVVWTSARVAKPRGSESTISVTDLADGRTVLVARASAPFTFSFPATDGRRAVWERDDFGSARPSSSIMGSDLPPARPAPRVLSGDTLASQPAVQGSSVVWKSGPGFAPGQILLSSWGASAAPTVLTHADDQAFSPTIGKGFVAWATGSAGEITIYDLRTSHTTAPSGARSGWVYGFPTAAGSWLAYSYMTGMSAQPNSSPPRGYIALRYLGG